jgi:20S proteasome alpha/beta subunit
MGDNHLYKKGRNRYLNRKIERGFRPVTVCIAAISNVGMINEKKEPIPPCIVFCADKLVSAGIQFESVEPKIKKITDYCYAMQSSNNALVSDLILERVRQKVGTPETPMKIEDIVRILSKECFDYKKEWFENNVLWKYNLAFDKFRATPEPIVADAVKEVRECEYPFEFYFIVLGLESSREAHLFYVDQDGAYLLQDSLGFVTIGIGAQLAFPQMTKYAYARYFPLTTAIPMVYISKKISERMQGVGHLTDLAVLHFKDATFSPTIWVPSADPDFMKQLDDAFATISRNESTELQNISKKVLDWINQKTKPPQP